MMNSNLPIYVGHIPVALHLIAFVAGFFLFAFSFKEDFPLKKVGKIVGALVSLAAILGIVCVLYTSTKKCCHENTEKPAWQHPPIDGSMRKMMPPGHGLPMQDKQDK